MCTANILLQLERKLLLGQDRVEETDEQLAASLKKQAHLETQLEEVSAFNHTLCQAWFTI